MRDNFDVSYETKGQYATDLFTDKAVDLIQKHNSNTPLFLLLSHLAPHTGNSYATLQAPADDIARFGYIQDKDRRTYAAMVSKLDASVGQVIETLATKNMLHNSVILFYSDNGGPTLSEMRNTASNYPFRGVS